MKNEIFGNKQNLNLSSSNYKRNCLFLSNNADVVYERHLRRKDQRAPSLEVMLEPIKNQLRINRKLTIKPCHGPIHDTSIYGWPLCF